VFLFCSFLRLEENNRNGNTFSIFPKNTKLYFHLFLKKLFRKKSAFFVSSFFLSKKKKKKKNMGQVHFGQPVGEPLPPQPPKSFREQITPKTHFLIKWGMGGSMVLAGVTGMCTHQKQPLMVPVWMVTAIAGTAIWNLETHCYWTKRLPYEAD
jgi:hypothetical protein